MAITKTGIQVDTDPTFSNPLEFEAQGEVRSVDATNLEPSTTYYTRGYVVELSKRTYSRNSRTFETLTPNYFTITNRQSTDTTVSIMNSANTDIALQYSLDEGKTWVDWNSSMGEFSVTLSDHQAVKLRGVNTTMNNNIFEATDFCDLSGDINTLINKVGGDIQLPNGCYAGLFLAFWQNYAKFYNAGIVLPSTIIGDDAYAAMFHGQAYFSSVPKINASVIGVRAFEGMFSGCTGITSIPSDLFKEDLTLTSQCCNQMFLGCTGITSIPSDLLPFTTLAELCFKEMFSQCSSIRNTPNLPATALANGCYSYMFWNCSSLTSVPADLLPATTLARNCYGGMLSGTGLTVAPTLPATTIPELAYSYMLADTDITEIDLSNVTSVGTRSFEGMFQGCSNLNSVKSPNISTWDTTVFKQWLRNVAATGDFYKGNDDLVVPIDSEDGVPVGWTLRVPIGDNLRITNEYNGSNVITLYRYNSQTANISLDYSTDNGATWTHWTATSGNFSVQLPVGGSVILKGDNERLSDATIYDGWKFDSDHEFSVSGNVMSLLDSTRMRTDVPSYTFTGLFASTKVTSVQSGLLPATELTPYCYSSMFANCQYLTSVPADLLPATDLGGPTDPTAIGCYSYMFQSCSNLTNTPNLLATVLAPYCYQNMFSGCTSLVHPMAELPADSILSYSYQSMFYGCTSLVCSPNIMATSVTGSGGLEDMFNGCSSLNEITLYITNWTASYASDWVDGVAAEGEFVNLGQATITSGNSGIPTGWIELKSLYFYIKNTTTSSNNLSIYTSGNYQDGKGISYSKDLSNWNTLPSGYTTTTITLSNNEIVYFRGKGGFNNFRCTAAQQNIVAGGSLARLLDYDDPDNITYIKTGAFDALFYNNTNITNARIKFDNITEVRMRGLSSAFYGCTSLSRPIDISGITEVQESNSQGVNNGGFGWLYYGCSSLSEAIAPNVSSWGTYKLYEWLKGTASSGTVYAHTGLSIPSGDGGIPTNWSRANY